MWLDAQVHFPSEAFNQMPLKQAQAHGLSDVITGFNDGSRQESCISSTKTEFDNEYRYF